MSVGGYQINDGVKLSLRAMTDWVASILLSCAQNKYLVDNGVSGVECLSCQTKSAWFRGNNGPQACTSVTTNCPDGASVNLVSAGGRVTSCSCPDGYSEYVHGSTEVCLKD